MAWTNSRRQWVRAAGTLLALLTAARLLDTWGGVAVRLRAERAQARSLLASGACDAVASAAGQRLVNCGAAQEALVRWLVPALVQESLLELVADVHAGLLHVVADTLAALSWWLGGVVAVGWLLAHARRLQAEASLLRQRERMSQMVRARQGHMVALANVEDEEEEEEDEDPPGGFKRITGSQEPGNKLWHIRTKVL